MVDELPRGATPLSEEERDDLIPSHITNRNQLNEWEQRNIIEAEQWAFSRRRRKVLCPVFLKELHRRMFDRTWGWAGRFRTTDKNIGVSKHEVPVALKNTCDDAALWIRDEIFPPEEIAARFHHRLVAVHPFPNGNGRHARLAADVLLHSLDRPRLAWGGDDLDTPGRVRVDYIDALRAADDGDYEPLLRFLDLI